MAPGDSPGLEERRSSDGTKFYVPAGKEAGRWLKIEPGERDQIYETTKQALAAPDLKAKELREGLQQTVWNQIAGPDRMYEATYDADNLSGMPVSMAILKSLTNQYTNHADALGGKKPKEVMFFCLDYLQNADRNKTRGNWDKKINIDTVDKSDKVKISKDENDEWVLSVVKKDGTERFSGWIFPPPLQDPTPPGPMVERTGGEGTVERTGGEPFVERTGGEPFVERTGGVRLSDDERVDERTGGEHTDERTGGEHTDERTGGEHTDERTGGEHTDERTGGEHTDERTGGEHTDERTGGEHTDERTGGEHTDERTGGEHTDERTGGEHTDERTGGEHTDERTGGEHTDERTGGEHTDERTGGEHTDERTGGEHTDERTGGEHTDERTGGEHTDERTGGEHTDERTGGEHTDERTGGEHTDERTGGMRPEDVLLRTGGSPFVNQTGGSSIERIGGEGQISRIGGMSLEEMVDRIGGVFAEERTGGDGAVTSTGGLHPEAMLTRTGGSASRQAGGENFVDRVGGERAEKTPEYEPVEHLVFDSLMQNFNRLGGFDFAKHSLPNDFREPLLANISILQENPDIRIRIEGHTDTYDGTEDYPYDNKGLGERRANAVRDFLIDQGISSDRLEVISLAAERPLVTTGSKDAESLSRRVEFQVLKGDNVVRSSYDPELVSDWLDLDAFKDLLQNEDHLEDYDVFNTDLTDVDARVLSLDDVIRDAYLQGRAESMSTDPQVMNDKIKFTHQFWLLSGFVPPRVDSVGSWKVDQGRLRLFKPDDGGEWLFGNPTEDEPLRGIPLRPSESWAHQVLGE